MVALLRSICHRVIIVGARTNPCYSVASDRGAVVMVDPEILAFSSEVVSGEEGCLSVPNERGQVQRAEKITIRYRTLNGKAVETEFSGFPARIVQHEVDHLNGVLFVDRV